MKNKTPKARYTSMRSATQDKLKSLVAEVVKQHGTSAVSRAEVRKIALANPKKFPHPSAIVRNPAFKVARGMFKVNAAKLKQALKAQA